VLVIYSCNNDDTITPAPVPAVVSEFRSNLSELNLFTGNLSELNITPNAFPYKLNTPLFSDYATKQRLIALPKDTKLSYNGDGLPIFPDGSLIAKTFYYNVDERDLSLGRQIIETRILIKTDGEWVTGDYKWNEDQTDAVLDLDGSTLPVSWVDASGNTNSTDYVIPSNADCFTCHSTYDNLTPIGPKLRNLNFDLDGSNQLQQLITNQNIDGLASNSEVSSTANWLDESASLESRARAYMDINCAYCHKPGGFCENESTLRLTYETSLEDSQIIERNGSISFRITTDIPGLGMPFIGTTLTHTEGVDLIQAYLDTL
tara:strand:- start:13955 stop:14905 length:951 start_codon:yes stop_codon:yes gene_type:complete